MPRKPKASDIDLALEKIDAEIEELKKVRARLVLVKVDLQSRQPAETPATPKRSRSRRTATAEAPAAGGI